MRLPITFRTAILAGILFLLLLPKGVAEIITIQISARVSYVEDSEKYLARAVAVGDLVTGVYTYDASALDRNPMNEVGDYRYNSAHFGIALSINNFTFRTASNKVDFLVELVNNYQGRDNYLLRSYENVFDLSAKGSNVMNHIAWQLDDPRQTALSSVALPTTAPDLANWESIFGLDISSQGQGSDNFLIRSKVTSAMIIPEPSAWTHRTMGFLALLGYSRRGRSR